MGEFLTAKRIINPALTLAMGATVAGCFAPVDRDYYIRNAPGPHQISTDIPPGKVFPPGVSITFRDSGNAEYQISADNEPTAGLVGVNAFCGNPTEKQGEKRDPHHLYAIISMRDGNNEVKESTAGIPNAAACVDGVLSAADQSLLQ